MKKILIIDDNVYNLDVLYLICKEGGYEVKKFTTASNICKVIEDFEPALVFIDVLLGKVNGIDVCKLIKKNGLAIDVKFVLMSACNRSLDRAHESGCADSYLAKPYDIENVLALAEQLIGMP